MFFWRDLDWNIKRRLDELEECESCSTFCQEFYRLLADWIAKPKRTPHGESLYDVFKDYLDAELSHHMDFEESGAPLDEVSEWIRTSPDHRQMVEELLARLEACSANTRQETAAKRLLTAQCFFHLGQTELVIMALESALAAGGEHPLVHFAHGYNLYQRAMQRFTTYDALQGLHLIEDVESFEAECWRAVHSFRAGVSGNPFDAHLYWWIGGVLENVAGALNDARDAWLLAAQIDPEGYGDLVAERLRSVGPYIAEAVSPEEEARFAEMDDITAEELHRVREKLGRIRTIKDLLGDA